MIKLLFTTIIIFTSSILAQTNEEKGLSIVEKSIDLDKGFIDVSSEGVMVLKDKSGNESVREFKNLTHIQAGRMGPVFIQPKLTQDTQLAIKIDIHITGKL